MLSRAIADPEVIRMAALVEIASFLNMKYFSEK